MNGGGSGSAELSCTDACLTEITVGSGLVQSQLFDYFTANTAEPALFFALRVSSAVL